MTAQDWLIGTAAALAIVLGAALLDGPTELQAQQAMADDLRDAQAQAQQAAAQDMHDERQQTALALELALANTARKQEVQP